MPTYQDYQYNYFKYSVSEEPKLAYGTVGAVGADVTVAQIANPGANGGRGVYKVWGHAYHDADDGLKLDVGGTDKVTFAAKADTILQFGPILVNIDDDTSDITIETAAATTAKASATLYAKRVADA